MDNDNLASPAKLARPVDRFTLRRSVNAAVAAVERRTLLDAAALSEPTEELEPPLKARADVLRLMRLQVHARQQF